MESGPEIEQIKNILTSENVVRELDLLFRGMHRAIDPSSQGYVQKVRAGLLGRLTRCRQDKIIDTQLPPAKQAEEFAWLNDVAELEANENTAWTSALGTKILNLPPIPDSLTPVLYKKILDLKCQLVCIPTIYALPKDIDLVDPRDKEEIAREIRQRYPFLSIDPNYLDSLSTPFVDSPDTQGRWIIILPDHLPKNTFMSRRFPPQGLRPANYTQTMKRIRKQRAEIREAGGVPGGSLTLPNMLQLILLRLRYPSDDLLHRLEYSRSSGFAGGIRQPLVSQSFTETDGGYAPVVSDHPNKEIGAHGTPIIELPL